MRRDADDLYRQIIEAEAENRAAASATLNSAVQNAMRRFAENGVTGFTDAAGRNWGLYEYTNMAMRTAIQRAGLKATLKTMARIGHDLCFVQRHAGACPICEAWYGKILSASGLSAEYPSVQEAMDAGLFHPNCCDILQVYIPGVSNLDAGMGGFSQEASAARYAASQRQQAPERDIRRWKRIQAASITPEDERAAKAHVDLLQRRLRALTGEYDLPRRYDREGGRVPLSDAAKAIKPFTIDENGRVITDRAAKQESSPGTSEKSATMPLQNASGTAILQYTGIEQTEAPMIATREETDAAAASTKESGDGVNFICRLDRSIYSCVTEDITTDEVVITEERIQHIKDRHPNDYERYFRFMADMIVQPQYIIEDADLNTAFVLRQFEDENSQFRLILRLHTAADAKGRKNSVITFQYIKAKEFSRLIRNKKILYRASDL